MKPVRAALCIGHPGHELRVIEWIHQCQPRVYILTDGSGSDRPSRSATSARLLDSLGARQGCVFGAYTDREFFNLVLAGDPAPLIEIARRLADDWHRQKIDLVAGDMLEGFNVAHDFCRMFINAAVERCAKLHQWKIANYEFALESLGAPRMEDSDIVIELDDVSFQRKRHLCYTAYPELATEITRMIARVGESPFRVESLQTARVPAGLNWESEQPPFYETYGANQVAVGHYQQLITYKMHVQPLALALWDWAVSGRP